jgi:serine/threonine protein kinase
VRLYHYWLDAQRRLNMAMEYAGGGELTKHVAHHMAHGTWTSDRFLQLAADLVAGLAHMHSFKLSHRDIKPANILMDNHGRAMLGDFGSARDRGLASMGTTTAGTPLYWAPEILNHDAYGAAADVWALGVTLFQAATGAITDHTWPFLSGHEMATVSIAKVARAASRSAVRWDALLSALADTARPLIHMMLTKSPEVRVSAARLCMEPALAAKLRPGSAPVDPANAGAFHAQHVSDRAARLAALYPAGAEIGRTPRHVLKNCIERDDNVALDVSVASASDNMFRVVEWLQVSLRACCRLLRCALTFCWFCRITARSLGCRKCWTAGWIR